MNLNRRSLLKGFAVITATIPLAAIASKLPDVPLSRSVASGLRKTGAWAEIKSGRITSVNIISGGSGYKMLPVIVFYP